MIISINEIYLNLPNFLQNTFVSIFDLYQYTRRHGGKYKYLKNYYKKMHFAPLSELKKIQNKRLVEFINFAVTNSKFYKKYYKDIDLSTIKGVDDLSKLPIIDKETVRKNIQNIVTIDKRKGYIAHTGGTTGKSLEVLFTWEDVQERWGILDAFREEFGYKFGKRTAWFSGKTILNKRDEIKKRFWKTDYLFNIRYYSTFHITPETIPYYIENLNKYKPIIISGFPSSVFEIANYARIYKIQINFNPTAIFTTAETLVSEQTKIIEEVFKCKVYDQYSSSEGAPFVVQCCNGNMHYELLSGVIEIIDENLNPTDEGEILVTSFITRGTPLIRYKIGDRMKISSQKCSCGNNNPIIGKTEGRSIDFIYSNERGKINLGNVSNCVKHVNGVMKFQLIQNKISEIIVKIVKDSNVYSDKDEKLFMKELRDRLGDTINIIFEYVDDIPKEKSGKYKIVKNEIANLV
jgi:phenylacetate-CoA ligase